MDIYIVDTNLLYSAILRPNNKIAKFILDSSSYQDILNRKVNVEELKLEQKYKPTSSTELSQIAEEANIEESIEFLLADLKSMG